MAESENGEKSTVGAKSSKPKRKRGPLTIEEFRAVLERTSSLGIGWTADVPPNIRLKKEKAKDEEINEELLKLMKLFPNFPLELASVIYYILTGSSIFSAGSKELREQKAAVVKEFGIIDDSYRSEFFFKHATKVPYFSDLDWEVVVKEFERGVEGSPSVSYALLSLRLDISRGPVESRPRRITVAVNQELVDELIATLTDVSRALQRSKTAAATLKEATVKREM